MPKLVDVLNSDNFRNLSIDKQNVYLDSIGISRQDAMNIEGVKPIQEQSFLSKLGSSVIHSVAQAGETIAAIPLYNNIEGNEELSSIDSTAIRVMDYFKKLKEEHPVQMSGKEGFVEQSVLSATQSLGTSLTFGLPQKLTSLGILSGVGAAAGVAAAGASFEGQRRGTSVTTYFDLVDELEKNKGRSLTDSEKMDVWNKAAKPSGKAEAGFELAGNVIGGGIARAFLKPGTAATGKEMLKQMFDKPVTTTLKQGTKAYVVDQIVAEQPGEILTSLVQDKYAREAVGLKSQFQEQLPITIGSTALLGAGMSSVDVTALALHNRSTNKQIKDLIFGGVDASNMTPEARDAYVKTRAETAIGLSKIISKNLGSESANNFLDHIEKATIVGADPTKQGDGSLPYNDSIFTKALNYGDTVQPDQTGDIDMLGSGTTNTTNSTNNQVSEDFIKAGKEKADADKKLAAQRMANLQNTATSAQTDIINQQVQEQQQVQQQQVEQQQLQQQQAEQERLAAIKQKEDDFLALPASEKISAFNAELATINQDIQRATLRKDSEALKALKTRQSQLKTAISSLSGQLKEEQLALQKANAEQVAKEKAQQQQQETTQLQTKPVLNTFADDVEQAYKAKTGNNLLEQSIQEVDNFIKNDFVKDPALATNVQKYVDEATSQGLKISDPNQLLGLGVMTLQDRHANANVNNNMATETTTQQVTQEQQAAPVTETTVTKEKEISKQKVKPVEPVEKPKGKNKEPKKKLEPKNKNQEVTIEKVSDKEVKALDKGKKKLVKKETQAVVETTTSNIKKEVAKEISKPTTPTITTTSTGKEITVSSTKSNVPSTVTSETVQDAIKENKRATETVNELYTKVNFSEAQLDNIAKDIANIEDRLNKALDSKTRNSLEEELEILYENQDRILANTNSMLSAIDKLQSKVVANYNIIKSSGAVDIATLPSITNKSKQNQEVLEAWNFVKDPNNQRRKKTKLLLDILKGNIEKNANGVSAHTEDWINFLVDKDGKIKEEYKDEPGLKTYSSQKGGSADRTKALATYIHYTKNYLDLMVTKQVNGKYILDMVKDKETGKVFYTLSEGVTDKDIKQFFIENKQKIKLTEEQKSAYIKALDVLKENNEIPNDEFEMSGSSSSSLENETSSMTQRRKLSETRVGDANEVTVVSNIFGKGVENGQVVSSAYKKFHDFMGGFATVGASDSIPKFATGFINKVSKLFGLKTRIFIMTTSDLASLDLGDTAHLVRELVDKQGTYTGAFYNTAEGVSFLVLDDTKINNKATLLRTMSHEVGHAIFQEHYENATVEQQDAINADFDNWIEKMAKGGDERAQALRELYQDGRLVSEETFNRQYKRYLNSDNTFNTSMEDELFEEYSAEQIAKYIKVNQIGKGGIVTQFFSDLASKLRKLFTAYQQESFKAHLPSVGISEWLDTVIKNKDNMGSTASEEPMVTLIKRGPSYTAVDGPNVSKTTSVSHIKGIAEKMGKNTRGAFNWANLPSIQSIDFQVKVEKYIEEDINKGKDFYSSYMDAIKKAVVEDKNGVVAWTLNEEALTNSEQAKLEQKMFHDDNGVPVYQNALEAYNILSDKERSDVVKMLRYGDHHAIVFDKIENATKATGSKVTSEMFNAYQAVRTAMDNIFKQSSALRYNRILDSILNGVVSGDLAFKAKVELTRNLFQIYKKGQDRFSTLRANLLEAGLSSEQVKDIIAATVPVYADARKTLTYYTKGGPVGYIPRFRESKAENPFVVRIRMKTTNKKTKKVSISDKYVTFFETAAERDDFVKRISSEEGLKALFDTEYINPDDFKNDAGKFMIEATDEYNDALLALYPVNKATKSMLDNITLKTLDAFEKNTDISKENIADIRKGILADVNKQYIKTINKRYNRRKNRGQIRGEDVTNPLETMIADVRSAASYIARVNAVERTTNVLSTLTGEKQLEAISELKNSYNKYMDSKDGLTRFTTGISNAATTTFMMFRGVTAVAQAHQVATFGTMEMINAGASTKEAVSILGRAYVESFIRRIGVSAQELEMHLKGDSNVSKALRKVLPKASFNDFAKWVGQISSDEKKGKSNYFSKIELERLQEHSDNNDVTDNATKEFASMETALRSGARTEGVVNNVTNMARFLSKAGMLMFNEMEIVNRESSFIAGFRLFSKQIAESKGKTIDQLTADEIKLADLKAINMMKRINNDFSKYNKTKFVRKYPQLAPVFALTGFAFHSLGLIGKRTFQALKGDRRAAKAVVGYAVMAGLLGGARGEPLWDQLSKLAAMLFGKDFLLEAERYSEGTDHDAWLRKMFTRFFFRGLPAVAYADWTNNVNLSLPFLNSIADAYTGKSADLSKFGAGGAWLFGTGKAISRIIKDHDFARAFEDLNVGGLSNAVKAYRYKTEGYTTTSGSPFYFEGKPRKLTNLQAAISLSGFKTVEAARTQDIINAEMDTINGYWKRKRDGAINDSLKLMDPYIKNNKEIPEEVRSKVKENVQNFNKSLLKDKDALTSVKPITDFTDIIKSRYSPNKKRTGFEKGYSNLISK